MDWKERDAIGDHHGDLDDKLPKLRPAVTPEHLKQLRLMNAAPTMYAALRATMDWWETTGFAPCDPDCECVVDTVREAIAKAEGK